MKKDEQRALSSNLFILLIPVLVGRISAAGPEADDDPGRRLVSGGAVRDLLWVDDRPGRRDQSPAGALLLLSRRVPLVALPCETI